MIFWALPPVSPTTKLSWAIQSLRAMASVKNNSNDYVTRVLGSALEVPAAQWNALLALQRLPGPFMSHEYLAAMESSASASPATGWTPRFITLWQGSELLAGCALYLKDHSYGEYV